MVSGRLSLYPLGTPLSVHLQPFLGASSIIKMGKIPEKSLLSHTVRFVFVCFGGVFLGGGGGNYPPQES